MVQKKIFGPKGVEVTWLWRKLHSEEFDDLYSSPNRLLFERQNKEKLDGRII